MSTTALGTGSGMPHVVTYERVRKGRYYADFRRDKRLYPEVYHCIIQEEGSTQILSWSQHRSLECAIAAARRELDRLAGEQSLDKSS
jgi:hypothetical protein